MTIEQFSREQFEQALTDAGFKFDDLGYIQGERCYHIALDAQSGIRVRSSIHTDGQSASAGTDSIRVYLVSNGKPLASKEITASERWVTRVPGWDKRLVATIDRLRDFRRLLGNCKSCGAPNMALKSHTPKNPGRTFTKCSVCGQWGTWLNDKQIDAQIPLASTADSKSSALTDTITGSQREPVAASTNGLAFLADLANLEEDVKVAPVIVKEFKPSPYQEAIRDFVLQSQQALRVEAYAGSGKTSTNAFVCRALDSNVSGKVKMMVFSKANQLDMQKKIPDWIPATTTHSAGFSDIRRVYRNVKVDERKTLGIFKDIAGNNYDLRDSYPAVAKLVSLTKNTLGDASAESLDQLCERYDIQVNGARDTVYDAVGTILTRSREMTNVVDFDDMLWFPASSLVSVEKCDLLFVDEYQDNNTAQEQYYLKTHARIIFVGDARQAIYGFRGAMLGAMDTMQTRLNSAQLPLPISYRCAKSIIALAQTIVPQIQARDDAPEGLVTNVSNLKSVQPGDMVLCRNNAPLVKPCFELIRAGVKATIKGRDIGTNLMNLVHKVEKKSFASSFLQLLGAIQDYTDNESAKLNLQHKEAQAASLQDQCETIMALSENCNSMADLEHRVKTIFSDEVAGVMFSTAHRAKGLESQRVFVLRPDLMQPQKYDVKSWQLEQLDNLRYVCITRAMNELYWVTEL